MTITKDTVISDILKAAPETMPAFQALGMHCLGCALATSETLEQACNAHAVDVEDFLPILSLYMNPEIEEL